LSAAIACPTAMSVIPAPEQRPMRNTADPFNIDLSKYDIRKYPDYRPQQPPDLLKIAGASYLDEFESVWGRPWGAMGIGKLREVGLCKPLQWETEDFFTQDPNFFLLRHTGKLDFDYMLRSHEEYAEILTKHGVKIHWMEYENPIGAYGPMRKLFVIEEVRFVRGGAIIPRFGHASFKRGLEREFTKFVNKMGCPVLLTVHGGGVYEVAPMFVPLTDDVWVGALSCAGNQEGLDQIMPVLHSAGVREVHVMQLQTIMDSFASGGEFHTDMIIHPVAEKLAIIYPGSLPWATYTWLNDLGYKLIEIPADEQRACYPANLLVLEPGKVIMNARAEKTIALLRKAGVEVVAFDSGGIMQGGTNGIKCITMEVLRDDGPRLRK
jgi:N-dimethylarginine dimethylaminohydrolase